MHNGSVWPGRRCCMGRNGFTLVELLVVMAILALLLSLALPRYFASVDRAREQALKQELSIVRKALDQYYADQGQYPDNLQTLVAQRYLNKLPWDPVLESSDGWVITPPELPLAGGVYTIHSAAPGQAADGSAYADW